MREGTRMSRERFLALVAWVEARDPELIAAVDDVDRTLIAQTLALGPLARVRASTTAAYDLARFRRASSD